MDAVYLLYFSNLYIVCIVNIWINQKNSVFSRIDIQLNQSLWRHASTVK